MKRSGRHISSRGYTLVEIGLALAVLGLLLGGSLLPFSARERDDRQEKTQEAIQRAIDAVAAYAVRHQTAEGYSVALAGSAGTVELPGGRPYLPCPDIDGDGVENRRDLPAPTPSTINIGDLSDGGGVCQSSGGALPWATLGLPAFDLWGNPFTYRVDIAYSHGILGFGPETRADKFNPALQLTTSGSDIIPRPRQDSGDDGLEELPMVVCRNLDCEEEGELVAGVIAESDITVPDGNVTKAYDEGDALDGVAFVIISHGPNGTGFGALHLDGTPSSWEVPSCGNINNATHQLERLNAFTCNSPSSGDAFINFVDAPRSDGDDGFFDDIVGWMSGESLIAEMGRSGVLPVDELPQLGP